MQRPIPLIAALLLASLPVLQADESNTNKPNILLIVVDQMRSTSMGMAGSEKVYTPNLDLIAQGGSRFVNAIANCPSCAPARATLFTGLHTLSHRVVNNDLQVRLDTGSLARSLTADGYDCGYIGKWHLAGGSRNAFTPPGPLRLGFDDYWASANCTHEYMDSFYYENSDPKPKWIKGYEPIFQTDLALRYMEKKSQGSKPFFLTIAFGPPHDPYGEMPKRYLDRYPWPGIDLPRSTSRYVPREILNAKKQVVAGYYAHISALDEQVGRLLEFLKAHQLTDNTLIVFTSDHGDMLGNHEAWYKSQPWRESIGIPLLVRWPGHIPADRVTKAPVSLVDLMPTILSLVGLPIPAGTEGANLAALMKGDEKAAPNSVFINFLSHVAVIPNPPFRGVVTATHTYSEDDHGQPWLLYDDEHDPQQTNNLISWSSRNNPEVVALQKIMHTKLASWMRRLGDTGENGDAINARYMPGSTEGQFPASHYSDKEFDRLKALRND
jgi:arylsulfatase A-like enzyme